MIQIRGRDSHRRSSDMVDGRNRVSDVDAKGGSPTVALGTRLDSTQVCIVFYFLCV
jgi:hypothetical protein